MKILVLTDLHGMTELIDSIGDDLHLADVVVLCGDITHFGEARQAKHIIDRLKASSKKILAVPGNCDKKDVNFYLSEHGHSLDVRYTVVDGLFFMGVGGSLPCPGKTPNEYSEEEFMNMLEMTVACNSYGLPVILVAHHPPFNTMADKLPVGFHIGSHSIRFFIEKYQPVACFCGHVHESAGTDYIGNTVVLNPGPFKTGAFAWVTIDNNIANPEILSVFAR